MVIYKSSPFFPTVENIFLRIYMNSVREVNMASIHFHLLKAVTTYYIHNSHVACRCDGMVEVSKSFFYIFHYQQVDQLTIVTCSLLLNNLNHK